MSQETQRRAISIEALESRALFSTIAAGDLPDVRLAHRAMVGQPATNQPAQQLAGELANARLVAATADRATHRMLLRESTRSDPREDLRPAGPEPRGAALSRAVLRGEKPHAELPAGWRSPAAVLKQIGTNQPEVPGRQAVIPPGLLLEVVASARARAASMPIVVRLSFTGASSPRPLPVPRPVEGLVPPTHSRSGEDPAVWGGVSVQQSDGGNPVVLANAGRAVAGVGQPTQAADRAWSSTDQGAAVHSPEFQSNVASIVEAGISSNLPLGVMSMTLATEPASAATIGRASEDALISGNPLDGPFASLFGSTPILPLSFETSSAAPIIVQTRQLASTFSAPVVVPAMTAAAVVGPMMFYFPRLGSASAFMLDSIAALTDEFTLPAIEGEQVLPTRALTVTAAVIAADLILLTTIFRRRSLKAVSLDTYSVLRR